MIRILKEMTVQFGFFQMGLESQPRNHLEKRSFLFLLRIHEFVEVVHERLLAESIPPYLFLLLKGDVHTLSSPHVWVLLQIRNEEPTVKKHEV
eukprot:Gb_09204 [translate_table: standard]